MRANFQQEGKVQDDRQRRKSLPRQGVSTEAQFLRTMGGTPSGPYALLILSPERVDNTSFDEILILGMTILDGGGDGGTAPESSKVELEEKVSTKSSALSVEETAIESSDRKRGGKDDEVKLLERFLARCQKEREEFELESSEHLLRMKLFLADRRIDFARFRATI